MSTLRALAPALGASLLFTLGGGGEKIAFAPEAGAAVQKSFKIGGDYSLDSFNVVADGNDMSGMLGSFEMSVKHDTHIDTTDVYKAVADGHPKDLLRTFDGLGGSVHVHVSQAATDIPEMNTASALEGKTVAFHWNADKSEYERSFHESEGDAALLENLQEDMDLRTFLPSSEVAENDSWKIELKSLLAVAMPGGDLSFMPEGTSVPPANLESFKEIFADFGKQFGEQLEGECTCTYKGAHEENGARLAEIDIKLEVATTLDLSDFLEKAIHTALEQSGVGAEVDFSLDTADLNLDFDGTGTLIWNLKAGRAQSFQLSGDVKLGIDLSVSMTAEGESHGVDASLEMSGSMHNELGTKE